MPPPNTRNAGLILEQSGFLSPIPGLRIVGTMPGVVVAGAACRNGPGAGTLAYSPRGLLSWQAPGSAQQGPGCNVAAGGLVMLEDGTDPSDWLLVDVYPDYLTAGAALVNFADAYGNGPNTGDVTSAEASAGEVVTFHYLLANVGNQTASNVLAWLDPGASGLPYLQIGSDGTHYYQPTSATDPNVLQLGTIAPGSTASVYVQRTTPAGSNSNTGLLNELQWTWEALN